MYDDRDIKSFVIEVEIEEAKENEGCQSVVLLWTG